MHREYLKGTINTVKQCKAIHNDVGDLLDREAAGTLNDVDRKKFALLIGRPAK